MNAREWEARESRLERLDAVRQTQAIRYARFHEPSDAEIQSELERRAKERGISVDELIEMNKPKGI